MCIHFISHPIYSFPYLFPPCHLASSFLFRQDLAAQSGAGVVLLKKFGFADVNTTSQRSRRPTIEANSLLSTTTTAAASDHTNSTGGGGGVGGGVSMDASLSFADALAAMKLNNQNNNNHNNHQNNVGSEKDSSGTSGTSNKSMFFYNHEVALVGVPFRLAAAKTLLDPIVNLKLPDNR